MEKSMKAMEENKQIFVIAKNILEVIQGETFDDLIPALTMVLADVGSGCEVEIDTYLSFLCDSVKKIIAARKIIEDAFEDNTQLH